MPHPLNTLTIKDVAKLMYIQDPKMSDSAMLAEIRKSKPYAKTNPLALSRIRKELREEGFDIPQHRRGRKKTISKLIILEWLHEYQVETANSTIDIKYLKQLIEGDEFECAWKD